MEFCSINGNRNNKKNSLNQSTATSLWVLNLTINQLVKIGPVGFTKAWVFTVFIKTSQEKVINIDVFILKKVEKPTRKKEIRTFHESLVKYQSKNNCWAHESN